MPKYNLTLYLTYIKKNVVKDLWPSLYSTLKVVLFIDKLLIILILNLNDLLLSPIEITYVYIFKNKPFSIMDKSLIIWIT